MRIWTKAASREAPSAGHYLKQVQAPDPVPAPGKLPVPTGSGGSDPQAVRQTAQGIVFIGLLIIIGFYGTQVWIRGTEAAHRKACRGNLHALGLSLQMYSQDHDGSYPPDEGDVVRALRTYMPQASCFICPSDDLARPARRKRKRERFRVPISYTFWSPRGANPEMRIDVARTPVLWDYNGGIPAGAHRQGGNVLYLDGHVRWRPLYLWSASNQPW